MCITNVWRCVGLVLGMFVFCGLMVVCRTPVPGELFTLAVLDRERNVEFNLVAKATDGGGRSCQADILLMVQDMNDNPPRFSSSHYEVTVFDNTTVRTPVAVVYAKDPDTGELLLLSLTCRCGCSEGGVTRQTEHGVVYVRSEHVGTNPSFWYQVKA